MKEQICLESAIEKVFEIPQPWKNSPKNMKNKLHTICSYMAMYPPSVPNHFIKNYSKEGDMVLDTFSGRGTTVLEAITLNRQVIGNDLNPLAFLLTKAKCNVPRKSSIIKKINELESQFRKNSINIATEEPKIRMIFSDYTLKQLIFLKNELKWKKSNVDTFLASLVLGILHGSSQGYLSLSMPNTFSMSPNYIKNYIEKNGLIKPNRDVFLLLRRKLERCYQQTNIRGKTYNKDARRMTRIKDASINLIVTSPPYTRVIRYGQFNWIRLWFLGENVKKVDNKLFFSQSLSKYRIFMKEVLNEMKRVLKPDGRIVLVIGDVKDRTNNEILNLAQDVWETCARPLEFKLVEPIIEDIIRDETKVSKIWGTKKGNATKIERILILRKI